MMTRTVGRALFLLLAHAALAQASQVAAPPGTSCLEEPPASRYRIRPGDTVDISLPFTPEFDQSAAVRPDGHITLRAVGDVSAVGLTVPGLTCLIEDSYGRFLRDPVVNVTVRDFQLPSVIVGGEVERPGKYDLRSDTTVTQAIAIAGGFRRSARHSEVYLFRRAADGRVEARVLDIKALMAAGALDEDVHLLPDDMLFVPQNTLSKIERFLPIPGVGLFTFPR
jgi:polysaccharide export outer membrane protein